MACKQRRSGATKSIIAQKLTLGKKSTDSLASGFLSCPIFNTIPTSGPRRRVPKFPYNPTVLANLQNSLSAPRLARYLLLAGGDLEVALEFHLWNAALGESLHVPMQHFELLFRNALNTQLIAHHGPAWYDTLYRQLGPGFQRRIDAAKDELRKQGRLPIQPPCVIAQFTFGAWIFLLDSRFDRLLWKFCLFNAFPNRPAGFTRQHAKNALERIKSLRNRIVHHEPVYHKPLDQELAFIISAASWICQDTATWIDFHCHRFRSVWNSPPSIPPPPTPVDSAYATKYEAIDWSR